MKDSPNKPIRFLVPFTPGAGTDTTARTIAQKLSDAWGQQAVVDNRTGAAGAIAVELTAQAVPDGYTICLISASKCSITWQASRWSTCRTKARPVTVAMLAGDVQVGFGTLFGVRPHMTSGRLRALAITAAKRSPAVPDLPTVTEAGLPGCEVDQWYGVITSAKVPRPIVRKLSAAMAEALKSPEVVKS